MLINNDLDRNLRTGKNIWHDFRQTEDRTENTLKNFVGIFFKLSEKNKIYEHDQLSIGNTTESTPKKGF
jgi:hypothetical protein